MNRCHRLARGSFYTHTVFLVLLTLLWIWGPQAQAGELDEERPIGSVGGALRVDPFTGVATTSIPIQVPPGRNGVQPNLQLSYVSSGGNGWIGMGWKLELGVIERQSKFGVNYGGDDYIFRMNGDSFDVVAIGGGEYRAKIEGRFTRLRKLTAPDGQPYWEATDKQGTKYLFGQVAAARSTDPADGNRIFKWCLNRVEDTNGNYMTVTYISDQGQIYLSQINYTGNGSISPTNQITFSLESRSDTPDLYVTNFRVRTAYRLKTIEALANGQRMQLYTLSYAASGATSRSLLSTIQQSGANGISTLPVMSIGYQTDGHTFASPYGISGFCGSDWMFSTADFDGNGKMDIYCHSNADVTVILSTDQGFAAPYTISGFCGWNWPLGTGDFNGDGKADLWCHVGTNVSVALSTDHGFASPYTLTDFCQPWWSFGTGDFNGDGKVDIYCHSNPEVTVALSTNQGFDAPYTISDFCANNWPVGTGDFNGDGKADLWCHAGRDVSIALSTDHSFAAPYTNAAFCVSIWPFGTADFNGDGKTDLWCHAEFDVSVAISTDRNFAPTYTNPAFCNWEYSFGTGDFNGDGKTDLWCHMGNDVLVALWADYNFATFYSNGGFCGSTWPVGSGDFNGDGKADLLCHAGSDVTVATAGTTVGYPDVLNSMNNGFGATTTAAYVPSTQASNTQLPFSLQRVNTITTNDGNGNVATTSYAYSGGFYHIGERDLRGVNYVKVTGPVGPNGERTITETWFHQGNDTAVDVNNPNVANGYMKGKPYRTRVTDGSGNLYAETIVTYTADADGVAPFYTPASQVDTITCDGTACGKQTRTVSTYDGYGNIVREDQYWDVNDASDDRTVVRTYALNPTNWIVGLPASETIYQGIGTNAPLAQTTFYYDGTASCSTPSTNQVPTQGRLTRVVRWLGGGNNPELRRAHDSYGNQICSRDANGNVTTWAYDTSATFPTVVTNALGQQTTSQYYGVDGIDTSTGLYGQIKRVTDPNGAVTVYEYDGFGRKSKVTNPDGFWTTTTYNSFGTIGAQHVRTDSSLGLSSWAYFDGLGRPIKKKSTGPESKIVVADTQYNNRGAVLRTSLPYFDGLGSPLWKTYAYDVLNRMIRTDNPDGTRLLACYDDWVMVTIDASNHRKRETHDAAGRLLRIDEYTGTVTSCDVSMGTPYATTTYSYDRLGNLTLVTDAKGNQTQMQFDTLGRKVAMKDPDMGSWTYVYDDANNLTQQTDAAEETTYYKYDALNRRLQKDFCLEKLLGQGDVVYTYDGATSNGIGRLTTVLDAAGTTTFFYDGMGRTVRTDKVISGTTYTVQSTFDGLGRITTITYPDNSMVSNAYTGAILQRVYEGTTTYAQYAGFNAMDQPSTLTLGNGVVTTYTYQPNTFRLATLNTVSGNTTLQNVSYGYDNNGNYVTLTDSLKGTQTFGYDESNRLVSATGPYGGLTYTYDQIGNMTFNSQVGTYTYPDSGASSVRPHAVSTAGANSYTYDANGNMVNGAGRILIYDYENRPTNITNGGQTTTFVYDGDGGRVKKIVGNTTTTYIGKLYECETSSGTTQCVKYIWAGGQRVAMKQVTNGTVDYYHGDHLGSTSVVTTATGTQEEDLTYYPYGAIRTDTGTTNVPYKYTNQELDASTGLYFYGARYYDTTLGRFLSADTIVPDAGVPQSFNRYAYVRNNPLRAIDPSGHCDADSQADQWNWACATDGPNVYNIEGYRFWWVCCAGDGYTGVMLVWPGELTAHEIHLLLDRYPQYGIPSPWDREDPVQRAQLDAQYDYIGGFLPAGTLGALIQTASAVIGGAAPVNFGFSQFTNSVLTGALAGGALGGLSAAANGGDIAQGIAFGAVVGGLTSAGGAYFDGLAGKAAEAKLAGEAFLDKAIAGVITNFGSGLISSYKGGRGKIGDMLVSATTNGAAGAITTPVGEILTKTVTFFGGQLADALGISVGDYWNSSMRQYAGGAAMSVLAEVYGDKLYATAMGRPSRFP